LNVKTKRIQGWERALAAWMQSAVTRKFEWGTFDCALAACDAVNAITGVDPAAKFRGKYSTEAEALFLLGPEGLGAFAAAIAKQFGMAEAPPTFAHRGDIVLVDNGLPGHALGIVDLSGRFAWCVCARGLMRMPMERWLKAWRVG
jgi:hypothetical protein